MTDKERMDYALLIRNVVEVYQSELRMAKLQFGILNEIKMKGLKI